MEFIRLDFFVQQSLHCVIRYPFIIVRRSENSVKGSVFLVARGIGKLPPEKNVQYRIRADSGDGMVLSFHILLDDLPFIMVKILVHYCVNGVFLSRIDSN